MEQYTHIAFLYVMSGLMIGTWLTAFIWRWLSKKEIHGERSQTFVFSLVLSILLIISITILWYLDGLKTVIYVYEEVHNFIEKAEKQFPVLLSLLLTVVGVFISFALLRPKIKVGEYMACTTKKRLVAHVYNAGLFSAHNVNAKLYSCVMDEGNKLVDEVALLDSENNALAWFFAHNNMNAIEFCTKEKGEDENIKKKLAQICSNEDEYFELHISATHAVSGITSTFVKRYDTSNIVKGRYINNDFNVYNEETKDWKRYKRIYNMLPFIRSVVQMIIIFAILSIFTILVIGINIKPISEECASIFFWTTFGIYILEIIRWWLSMPYKIKAEREYSIKS